MGNCGLPWVHDSCGMATVTMGAAESYRAYFGTPWGWPHHTPAPVAALLWAYPYVDGAGFGSTHEPTQGLFSLLITHRQVGPAAWGPVPDSPARSPVCPSYDSAHPKGRARVWRAPEGV